MNVLEQLDEWAEREGANVLVSRRVDLTAPEEWSVVLTSEAGQFTGYAMSPSIAIERALEAATLVATTGV